MTAKLPNLELILYKAKQILGGSQKFMQKVQSLQKAPYGVMLDYNIDVFPQTWSNTALGFDKDGGVSGQAMTKAYTTIVHENVTDFYVVFFGENPCYMIDEVTQEFVDDLRSRSLVGQREADKRY